MENEKNWTCEWHGIRGGKKWIGWVTEDEARNMFEEVGEKGKADILQNRGGLFQHVIESNKTSTLLRYENSLKDDLKRFKELERSISSKREKIKVLRKEIKALNNGKINRK